jgi:hypothetical protein
VGTGGEDLGYHVFLGAQMPGKVIVEDLGDGRKKGWTGGQRW